MRVFKGKIVRDGKRCAYIRRDRETVFQVNDTALEKLIKESVWATKCRLRSGDLQKSKFFKLVTSPVRIGAQTGPWLAVSWAASVFSRSGPFLAREVPFFRNFYLICCCLLFGKVWIVICELGYVLFCCSHVCKPLIPHLSTFLHIPSVFSSLFFHVHKMLWYADLILTFSLSREMLLWAEKLTYQPDSSMLRKWLIFSYLVRCLGFTFPSVCAPNEAELGRNLS